MSNQVELSDNQIKEQLLSNLLDMERTSTFDFNVYSRYGLLWDMELDQDKKDRLFEIFEDEFSTQLNVQTLSEFDLLPNAEKQLFFYKTAVSNIQKEECFFDSLYWFNMDEFETFDICVTNSGFQSPFLIQVLNGCVIVSLTQIVTFFSDNDEEETRLRFPYVERLSSFKIKNFSFEKDVNSIVEYIQTANLLLQELKNLGNSIKERK